MTETIEVLLDSDADPPRLIEGCEYLQPHDPDLSKRISRILQERNVELVQSIITYKGA